MLIFVKTMVIGEESPPPECIEATLQQFFIDDVGKYQDPDRFPFDKSRWCREGGCQFAFDRDEKAPLRCINCDAAPCACTEPDDPARYKRYALQRFTTTRVYVLDVDLNNPGRQGGGIFCKYAALRYQEEQELRKMEERLTGLENILFFHRTKCNGFRVAFETDDQITNMVEFESLCAEAERRVEALTPDRKFSETSWFKMDRITYRGKNYRSHAY